ncbi:MAG: hypothetical protein V1914_01175 [archaeon]
MTAEYTLKTDTLSLIEEIISACEEQVQEDNLPEILKKPIEHLTLEDTNRLANKKYILNNTTYNTLHKSNVILLTYYDHKEDYIARACALMNNEINIRYRSLKKRHDYLLECSRGGRITKKQCEELDELVDYFR